LLAHRIPQRVLVHFNSSNAVGQRQHKGVVLLTAAGHQSVTLCVETAQHLWKQSPWETVRVTASRLGTAMLRLPQMKMVTAPALTQLSPMSLTSAMKKRRAPKPCAHASSLLNHLALKNQIAIRTLHGQRYSKKFVEVAKRWCLPMQWWMIHSIRRATNTANFLGTNASGPSMIRHVETQMMLMLFAVMCQHNFDSRDVHVCCLGNGLASILQALVAKQAVQSGPHRT